MINTKRYKLETRWSLNMSDTLYTLIELEDQYLSIISVSTICQPRKEISEYEEGKTYTQNSKDLSKYQPYAESRAIHEFAKWPS